MKSSKVKKVEKPQLKNSVYQITKRDMDTLLVEAVGERIVGKLLTWAESSFTKPEQLDAIKSLLKSFVWDTVDDVFREIYSCVRAVERDGDVEEKTYEDGSQSIIYKLFLYPVSKVRDDIKNA